MDAIKIIRPDRIPEDTEEHMRMMQQRFRQESQLAARVAHEHIVPVYQVGEVNGYPWFSMQLVNGSSLLEMSRAQPLSAEQAARYMVSIARGVDVMHRHGILHGDIKPHNILIEQESNRPLITDFGLAELLGEDGAGEVGMAGTPAYMAPELAQEALVNAPQEELEVLRTVACDIYSLGATLWSILTGQSPCFENRTRAEQLTDVVQGRLRFHSDNSQRIPPKLKAICMNCLNANPSHRYPRLGSPSNPKAWGSRASQFHRAKCDGRAPLPLRHGCLI
jgi:eukaryotic-like serine/threonine-protein kinase